MKLEIGKYYRARCGQVFGPLVEHDNDTYPFSDLNAAENWQFNGGYDRGASETKLDLIEEVFINTAPPATVFKGNKLEVSYVQPSTDQINSWQVEGAARAFSAIISLNTSAMPVLKPNPISHLPAEMQEACMLALIDAESQRHNSAFDKLMQRFRESVKLKPKVKAKSVNSDDFDDDEDTEY